MQKSSKVLATWFHSNFGHAWTLKQAQKIDRSPPTWLLESKQTPQWAPKTPKWFEIDTRKLYREYKNQVNHGLLDFIPIWSAFSHFGLAYCLQNHMFADGVFQNLTLRSRVGKPLSPGQTSPPAPPSQMWRFSRKLCYSRFWHRVQRFGLMSRVRAS